MRHETRKITAPPHDVEARLRQYNDQGWQEIARQPAYIDGDTLVRIHLRRMIPDPIGPAENGAEHAH